VIPESINTKERVSNSEKVKNKPSRKNVGTRRFDMKEHCCASVKVEFGHQATELASGKGRGGGVEVKSGVGILGDSIKKSGRQEKKRKCVVLVFFPGSITVGDIPLPARRGMQGEE